ncbi:MAG: hypothetical protein IJV35_10635 [Neisseriaceae bacterium]|nr:hypothetical protein [Neisseriaceae bacterium]
MTHRIKFRQPEILSKRYLKRQYLLATYRLQICRPERRRKVLSSQRLDISHTAHCSLFHPKPRTEA